MCLTNLKLVIERAGSSMDRVLKTTVFLTDMGRFAEMNEVYKRHFAVDRPARSCIEVRALPFDAQVEIEAIAAL